MSSAPAGVVIFIDSDMVITRSLDARRSSRPTRERSACSQTISLER